MCAVEALVEAEERGVGTTSGRWRSYCQVFNRSCWPECSMRYYVESRFRAKKDVDLADVAILGSPADCRRSFRLLSQLAMDMQNA